GAAAPTERRLEVPWSEAHEREAAFGPVDGQELGVRAVADNGLAANQEVVPFVVEFEVAVPRLTPANW
ncbi:MAG TPA: hypothetical protein VIJ34_11595, partial [Acidimicrobiales bacterium]